MRTSRLEAGLLLLALALALPPAAPPALAASAKEINRDADASLVKLYERVPEARQLSQRAAGMLVFPSIVKAGFQSFGYVLFVLTDSALSYLNKSEGFEIGVGPSIVVLDAGKAKTLTTTTGQSDIYAFIFDQKGLMAGLGLQGSKISKLDR